MFFAQEEESLGRPRKTRKTSKKKGCGNAFKYNAHVMHNSKHTQVPRREDLNEELDLSVDVTVHIFCSFIFSEIILLFLLKLIIRQQ